MAGDEVIGIYVPGLTGPDYRQRAVEAGLDLLRATGHGEPAGPWLSIGVGVHSGIAFVGSIGVEGGNYQFAALGDTMNFGARLVAAAKGGRNDHERGGVAGRVGRNLRRAAQPGAQGLYGASAGLRRAGEAGLIRLRRAGRNP